jgi:hypothetical protein
MERKRNCVNVETKATRKITTQQAEEMELK